VASGNDVANTSADDASDDNDENSISSSSTDTTNKQTKAVAVAAVVSGPVFAQLPSKTEVVTWVSLSYAQRKMYEGKFRSTFRSNFLAHTRCYDVLLRYCL
jgi:hypothetical protein